MGHGAILLFPTSILSPAPVPGATLNMVRTQAQPAPDQGTDLAQVQELTFLILREGTLEVLYLCL